MSEQITFADFVKEHLLPLGIQMVYLKGLTHHPGLKPTANCLYPTTPLPLF